MRQSEIVKLFNSKRNNTIGKVIDNLCGQHLGSGLYRDVYVFKPDHKWVVKIERDMTSGQFANVGEWRNWQWNKEWKVFSKFLAPCLTINEFGNVLIQRRAMRQVDGIKKPYPDKIPNLLTDTKKQNFGWIGNQFVCCDYTNLITDRFKMKKATFWN